MSKIIDQLFFYLVSIVFVLYYTHYFFSKNKKRSSIFYRMASIVCIIVVIGLGLLIYLEFFVSQQGKDNLLSSSSFTGKSLGIIIYFLFLLGALGVIFAGIKSIKEKSTVTVGRLPIKGPYAIILGVFYLIVGLIFVSGVLRVGAILFLGW